MQKVSAISSIVCPNVAIATQQVTYQTKFQALLTDISVAIARGSCTALIGATGSGKTTFLRLLNRLIDPSQGTISIAISTAINDSSNTFQNIQQIPIQTLRRLVVLVPQEPTLLGMQVKEAIAYPLQLQKLNPQEIDLRLKTWIDKLQIDRQLLNRSERELSLGQRQWVAIARALVMQPEIILLDEPTSALDRGLSHLLLDILTEQTKAPHPMTVIMINHQLDLVQSWCDRLICLAHGQLTEDLAANEVDWQAIDESLKRDTSPWD